MDLKAAIGEIIGKFFSDDDLFDNHTVIEFLKANYGDVYYNGAGTFKISETSLYHGMLSRMIGESGLVENTNQTIKSININGNISENQLWKKKRMKGN